MSIRGRTIWRPGWWTLCEPGNRSSSLQRRAVVAAGRRLCRRDRRDPADPLAAAPSGARARLGGRRSSSPESRSQPVSSACWRSARAARSTATRGSRSWRFWRRWHPPCCSSHAGATALWSWAASAAPAMQRRASRSATASSKRWRTSRMRSHGRARRSTQRVRSSARSRPCSASALRESWSSATEETTRPASTQS